MHFWKIKFRKIIIFFLLQFFFYRYNFLNWIFFHFHPYFHPLSFKVCILILYSFTIPILYFFFKIKFLDLQSHSIKSFYILNNCYIVCFMDIKIDGYKFWYNVQFSFMIIFYNMTYYIKKNYDIKFLCTLNSQNIIFFANSIFL